MQESAQLAARTPCYSTISASPLPPAPPPPWEARGHTLPGVAQPRPLSGPTPYHRGPAGAAGRAVGVGRAGNVWVAGQRGKLGCGKGAWRHVHGARRGTTPQPSTLASVPAGPACAHAVHSSRLGHCPNQSHSRAVHPTISRPLPSLCVGQGQFGTPSPNHVPSPQLPACTPHGSMGQCCQVCCSCHSGRWLQWLLPSGGRAMHVRETTLSNPEPAPNSVFHSYPPPLSWPQPCSQPLSRQVGPTTLPHAPCTASSGQPGYAFSVHAESQLCTEFQSASNNKIWD